MEAAEETDSQQVAGLVAADGGSGGDACPDLLELPLTTGRRPLPDGKYHTRHRMGWSNWRLEQKWDT